MKDMILSADNKAKLYKVPEDLVHRFDYYLELFYDWLKNSEDAKSHRSFIEDEMCFTYDESDFVFFLNTYVFKEGSVVFIKELKFFGYEEIPEEYENVFVFNF